MKKANLLIALTLLVISQLTSGQDIFKQHGFEKKSLSLSNGHYNEFFNNEEIVQIGTSLLNTKTNKIITFVEEDTTKTAYISELSSRWLSPDPLAAKYPQISPYVYCANNPIMFIDPDGKELILSFATSGAMNSYTNIVNSGLGGKYQANLVAIGGTSNYRVEITTIDFKAKINSEQKAFYKQLNKVVTAKEIVNQSVVENDATVVVDSWQTNQIDIKDIEAFDAAGAGAATSVGALTHSHIEQLEKAKKGLGAGDLGATKTNANGNTTYTDYQKSHNKAVKAENKVNGNIRIENIQGGPDAFIEKDGTTTQQKIIPNSTGGVNVIKSNNP